MNIKKILSVVLISSFSVLTFAQESENDDIFKNQSVQKNDFYEITVEPSTQEISSGITKYFEEVKQKKLNIYKRLENERNKLNSAKKSVNAAKENQKSSLEKKKEALKNPKSKNQTSETPENAKKSSIYRFYGKHWDESVDKENGNFDYLMGCDVDLNNVDVGRERNGYDISGIRT